MDDDLLKNLFSQQIQAEIELLSQRVKAEVETANQLKRQNDLEEARLKNLERTRQVETQRNKLWLNISEQTANLIQELPQFRLTILGMAEQLEELEEQHLKSISERLDRIEYAFMLLLSGTGDGSRRQQLITDIERDRKQRLLEEHRRMLHELKMKRASYGKNAVPPHIVIEIEDLEEEIRELEE